MVTDRNLYARAVSDVISYYGYTHVALILNVRIDDLQRWSAGKGRPPVDIFLQIIDLKNEVEA
jgi:hypothetical protein